MADKAKHAYGSRANLQNAIDAGLVDAYDVLFLNGENEAPTVGWMDKNGNPVIVDVENTELKNQVSDLEASVANKPDADVVDAQISQAVQSAEESAKAYADEKVETTVKAEVQSAVKAEIEASVEKTKYEIADTPDGTLVDYREKEIRIMCPADAVWTKQNVGAGGDANCYYVTFKTYVPDDSIAGYVEHLNGQADSEVLTSLSVDANGRRYQPTWLAVAKYDDASDAWTYYGANSSESKFIGWDYQIDWYNENGVMVQSDCIRINLSNENCHFVIEPYYVGKIITDVEEKIKNIDSSYEIIEF